MDIIFIRDLRIDAVIGIYDWERSIRQTISIDLDLGADIRMAAKSDQIDDTLNYKAVAKRLIAFVGGSLHFRGANKGGPGLHRTGMFRRLAAGWGQLESGVDSRNYLKWA